MDNVGLKRGYLEIMDYREDYTKIEYHLLIMLEVPV